MSGLRRAWLDVCPGERRGVVTLDGRPERLLIERDGEAPRVRLGERRRIRIGARASDRREAFADLGAEGPALIRLPAEASAAEGALAEAEVSAEARADKGPVLRWLAQTGEGTPGLIAPGPTLEARLAGFSGGAPIGTGEEAREWADRAEEAALAVEHSLGDGLTLTIQPTRALVAVDLDWRRPGEASAHRRLRANVTGLEHLARLLRLKALAGTVAVDLLGFPREDRLTQSARGAFSPDGDEVRLIPPNVLGVLMLSLPHRERPVAEVLCAPGGGLSPRSIAQRLVRELEREGRAQPGRLIAARCAPSVAMALRPLAGRLGPRFSVHEVGMDNDRHDVGPA